MTSPSMTDGMYQIGPEKSPRRERQKAMDSLLLLETWLAIHGMRILESEPVDSPMSIVAYNSLMQRWSLISWFVEL